MFKFKQLETERLILRAPILSDVEKIYNTLQKPEVNRLVAFELPTLEKIKDGIEEQITKYASDELSEIIWYAELKETKELLGWVNITLINPQNKYQGNFGYIFDSLHWGKGYAFEGMQEILKFGFSNKNKLDSAEMYISPENVRSINLANRLGFKLVTILKRKWYFRENFYDASLYSLYSEEYKS